MLRELDADSSFLSSVLKNPINAELLSILPKLALPQCTLTAGCLFQAAWNFKSGKPAAWGVKDYDVFYFDNGDLSFEAEDAVIQRAGRILGDLGARVEIKNQARVHLWYGEKFGKPYPQLTCVQGGIDRFLVSCTRVGIDVNSGELYTPDGLDDMWNGILRMNPIIPEPELFARKCEAYRSRWPWLTIED